MDERGSEGAWESWWQSGPLFAFVENRDERLGTHDQPSHGSSWVLDVVRERDLANLLGGGAGASREIPFLATAQIGIDLDGEPPNDLAPFNEGSWHRVELGAQGQHPATLFRDLDAAQTQPVRLSVLPAPTPEARASLIDLVNLADAPEATSSDLDLLDQAAELLAVYHVGQGNLNALCGRSGAPLVYYDFGGGCLRNAKTYPVGLAYCGAERQPVLLSHWDFDHWFSATKHTFPAGSTWIAPSQVIGPRTKKFIHQLGKQGVKLVRWPVSKTVHRAGAVTVTLCTGTSKNDSGLALWADLSEGVVLSPGDACFDFVRIPANVTGPLAGLVASHHGATHVGSPVPKLLTSLQNRGEMNAPV